MPVDLGGMIIFGLLYVVGFIALGIALLVNGNKTIAFIFLAYIGAPIASILYFKAEQSAHIRERQKGEETNLKAFGQYCKGRKRIIYNRATFEENTYLAIGIEKQYTGEGWNFPGYKIAYVMWGTPSLSTRSGVKYIEDWYDKRYQGWQCKSKECRYSTESGGKLVPGSIVRSRYELILGDSGSIVPAPWPDNKSRRMSESSVKIVDRMTGVTLAEDTLYFLNGDSGVGQCPLGQQQLAELIADVFSTQ